MRHLLAISALALTSACFDFDYDLATCQREGRCATNNVGGGTGWNNPTGGGTDFTGGGGLRTDCPQLTDLEYAPKFYNYYSSGGLEYTEAHYQSDSGTVLTAQVIWSLEDAGTGVNGNTITERLDGGYNSNRRISLASGGNYYDLLSGSLTLHTSQSTYGSMSGAITAGYFYNSANLNECIFVPSMSFDTDTIVNCEPLTPECFMGGSANFYDDSTFTATSAYASCENRNLYMQVSWRDFGMDYGVSVPHMYNLAESPGFFPVQTYIQQFDPDGGSTMLFGEVGTFNLVGASRDAGGVFQANISNVLFYSRWSGIRTGCLSLASQTYDLTY